MINATLLVPGCIRMKPHSRCSGLLLSAWKALNLSGNHNKSNQWSWIINELSQNVFAYALFLMCGWWSLYTNTWDKRVGLKVIRKPTRSWWLVVPHGWSSVSLCSGKAWWWGNSPHQVHQTPRSPGASREGEGLDSAPLMVKNNMGTNSFQNCAFYTEILTSNLHYWNKGEIIWHQPFFFLIKHSSVWAKMGLLILSQTQRERQKFSLIPLGNLEL